MPASNMQTTDQWGSLLPKGIGNDQEAQQATSAMRQSPWYQDQLKQWGVTPQGDAYGNVNLNDDQQKQLLSAAQKNGIGISGDYQIDQNGQIAKTPSHLLRNILIGAGIGGAALTGLGAFGVGPLAGMLGGGSSIADLGAVSGAEFGGGAASTMPTLAAGLGAGTGTAGASAALPAIADLGAINGAMIGGGAGVPTLAGAGSTMAGLLPSTQIGTGMMPAITGGTGTALSGGAGGAGSLLSRLMGQMPNISTQTGALAQGIANNRAMQGNFAQQYDKNAIAAQDSANIARAAALKNLAQANFLQNGQSGYKPSTISLNGKQVTLPDYGISLPSISADQRAAGADLAAGARKTLAPGGTVTPQPLSSYATPGTGENLANTGATIAGLLPTIGSIFKMF